MPRFCAGPVFRRKIGESRVLLQKPQSGSCFTISPVPVAVPPVPTPTTSVFRVAADIENFLQWSPVDFGIRGIFELVGMK
jgi:hypothetical protein